MAALTGRDRARRRRHPDRSRPEHRRGARAPLRPAAAPRGATRPQQHAQSPSHRQNGPHGHRTRQQLPPRLVRARPHRGRQVRRRPGRRRHRAAHRAPGRRARAARGCARRREDPARAHPEPHAQPRHQARAVHARPDAGRHHRLGGLRPEVGRVRVPRGAGVHQPAARRRDQPHAPEDAVGAARGDGGAAGLGRRRDPRPARAVPGRRDDEPDRVRGHLHAARGAARPLPAQARARPARARRRGRGAHPARERLQPARSRRGRRQPGARRRRPWRSRRRTSRP